MCVVRRGWSDVVTHVPTWLLAAYTLVGMGALVGAALTRHGNVALASGLLVLGLLVWLGARYERHENEASGPD
jgi:hypothetical protein